MKRYELLWYGCQKLGILPLSMPVVFIFHLNIGRNRTAWHTHALSVLCCAKLLSNCTIINIWGPKTRRFIVWHNFSGTQLSKQHITFSFASVYLWKSLCVPVFCELCVLKYRVSWIWTSLECIHFERAAQFFAYENEKYSSSRNNSTEFHFIKFKRTIIYFFFILFVTMKLKSTQFDNVMFFGCCNERFIHLLSECESHNFAMLYRTLVQMGKC